MNATRLMRLLPVKRLPLQRPPLQRLIALCIWILLACSAAAYGQDAAQVLRLSVGYTTLKNSKTLEPEKRAEVDKLGEMAQRANAAKNYGDALKYLYHAMAIMQGTEWSTPRELTNALTIKLDRAMVEPSQSVGIRLGQLFSLDDKPAGKLSGSIALLKTGSDEQVKVLKTLDPLEADFSANPLALDVTVPDAPDGNYRIAVTFKPAGGDFAVTKSAMIHLERGLAAKAAAAKARATMISLALKAKKKEALLAELPSAEYRIGLYDLANASQIAFDHIDFDSELAQASAMLDALSSGADPLAQKRGDFKKAYRSPVDDTLQPYRMYVPVSYDGSKPFPLVIALHGMGGDENSIFDLYNKGAFKEEAEKRGYIVACPKGRQPASMYVGSAEQDVLDVIAQVKLGYRIDSDRIYMTGHSMGGFGTWSIAMDHPEIFAALAPISGGGNPQGMAKIAQIPQLVIHGDNDKTVPVERSRVMVEAAKKQGVEIKYIEVPGGSHVDVAAPAFKDIFDWFDSHRRKTDHAKAA
jgi:predicted esterase